MELRYASPRQGHRSTFKHRAPVNLPLAVMPLLLAVVVVTICTTPVQAECAPSSLPTSSLLFTAEQQQRFRDIVSSVDLIFTATIKYLNAERTRAAVKVQRTLKGMSYVVYSVLCVVCRVLCVVYCVLCVVILMSYVVCRISYLVCCMLYVVWCVSCIGYRTQYLVYRKSYVVCRMMCVVCCISYLEFSLS